jgi:hypothetical protein
MPVAQKAIKKTRKLLRKDVVQDISELAARRTQPARIAKDPKPPKGIKPPKANKAKRFKAPTVPSLAPAPAARSDSNYESDDEYYIDYGIITNEFYTAHFTQPDDELTKKFRSIIETDFYVENLPASFFDGLPNLQEKNPLPVKTTPLFSKLIAGVYENKNSKYDRTNVRVNIQFFTNNLKSFKKYAKKNSLEWVITEHRQLVIEILEYYKNRKPSLSTIENRLNAILRMIKIAYGNKTTPLYELFSIMVFQVHDALMLGEGDNRLNKHEAVKYINWQDVMTIQKQLENKFNAIEDKKTRTAYELNNDLLLLSMYSLIPPLRNEIKSLEFTTAPKHNKKDYVYYNSDKSTIVLKFNKIKKQHGKIHFDLTSGRFKNPHLAAIIRQSINLYPRKYLFTLKNSYPDIDTMATQRALDERLISIFFRYGIKNKISVNSLRSSYVSYRLSDEDITYNQKKVLVYQMRTSMLCLERSYRKVSQKAPVLTMKEEDKQADVMETSEASSSSDEEAGVELRKNVKQETQQPQQPVQDQYERKKQRAREYYEKHKKELNDYQKEYNKNKKTPFERNRERMCQMLNASPDYHKKMKDSTREKYKFVYDEVAKRWKWND